jgi:hypothetical protein
MNTAIIYHDNCPDGWTAAWVAHRALAPERTKLIPAQHGQPPPDLTTFDTVYIVDFSYPHKVMAEMAIEGQRTVVVLDHHRTAIDDICSGHGDDPGQAPWGEGAKGDKWIARYETPYQTVLDDNRSGAGITWDYFHPGEPRPPIVDYVEDRDLWRFMLQGSQEVNAYLRTVPFTLDEWDGLAEGWNTTDLVNIGTGALSHIEAYCRAAAGHAYWCTMGDRYFPIVNVTYESCSEVASYLLDHFDCDMAGYFLERGGGGWHYGFRSRNGVTVHDHAAAFGGGGHPQASGCVVPEIAHLRAESEAT